MDSTVRIQYIWDMWIGMKDSAMLVQPEGIRLGDMNEQYCAVHKERCECLRLS